MEERIKIGALLRSLRKRTGLAQVPFAHQVGIDRKQVYRIERATQSVGIDQFIAIYLSLGTSLSSLLADAASHSQDGLPPGWGSGAGGGEPPVDPQ